MTTVSFIYEFGDFSQVHIESFADLAKHIQIDIVPFFHVPDRRLTDMGEADQLAPGHAALFQQVP